jgi:hypothetical protein
MRRACTWPLLDVFETLVHLVQLADLADHPGAPLGVQPEYLIEVRAGAHRPGTWREQ